MKDRNIVLLIQPSCAMLIELLLPMYKSLHQNKTGPHSPKFNESEKQKNLNCRKVLGNHRLYRTLIFDQT